jgi:ATP-dependent Clp protease protease subunit
MKEMFIRFMAPVIPVTVEHLMRIVDKKLNEKYDRLNLLLSSPGGSVFHGLSVYNFLKGIPIQVHTYNFGSVDSIGVVMYCAGSKRYCVPHARFLIHGVKMNFQGQASFDEFQIHEQLKSMQIDQKNIARVIADNTGKGTDLIEKDMHDRKTLSPNEAKDYGLVTEIKSELLPANAEFVSIGEPIQQMPIQIMQQVPQAGNFTRSADIDIVTI